jgi:hypothetical protein
MPPLATPDSPGASIGEWHSTSATILLILVGLHVSAVLYIKSDSRTACFDACCRCCGKLPRRLTKFQPFTHAARTYALGKTGRKQELRSNVPHGIETDVTTEVEMQNHAAVDLGGLAVVSDRLMCELAPGRPMSVWPSNLWQFLRSGMLGQVDTFVLSGVA